MSNQLLFFTSLIISYTLWNTEKYFGIFSLVLANKTYSDYRKKIMFSHNKVSGAHVENKTIQPPNNNNTGVNKLIDNQLSAAKRALMKNLKHLELITTLENQLVMLSSKNQCSIDRLKDCLATKKEAQLNIIQLTKEIVSLKANHNL